MLIICVKQNHDLFDVVIGPYEELGNLDPPDGLPFENLLGVLLASDNGN